MAMNPCLMYLIFVVEVDILTWSDETFVAPVASWASSGG